MLVFFIVLVLTVTVFGYFFINQPQFGQLPSGERLAKIQQSPNYKNGKFQNLSITPDLTEGVSYYAVTKEFLFERKARTSPSDSIPSMKTDLLSLDINEEILVWFGHSSYYFQTGGKRFLVDPVLSGSASPLSFGTRAFPGTDRYTVQDLPTIDYLLISHDHWDHLDYQTLIQLKPKVEKVYCGLGTGAHFEHWGYDASKISEHDWNEAVDLDAGWSIHVVPARHFSGRGISRNKALWVSFVLQTPDQKLFIGGDSGYDTHFKLIGEQFGPFDLAILENGQYDMKWRYIHLLPEEILQAAKDLKAKRIFPVHSSKFVLGNHAWDEPLEKIIENNQAEQLNIITPMIGEKVLLQDSTQKFSYWWRSIK